MMWSARRTFWFSVGCSAALWALAFAVYAATRWGAI